MFGHLIPFPVRQGGVLMPCITAVDRDMPYRMWAAVGARVSACVVVVVG